MAHKCEHGYDGHLFKCPKGCHSQGIEKDMEEVDRNFDYFYKRLEAHGMSMGPPDRTVPKKG